MLKSARSALSSGGKSTVMSSGGKSTVRLDKESGQRGIQPGEKPVVLLVEALKNYKPPNKTTELIIQIEFKNTVVKESNRLPYKQNGPILVNLEHTFYWNTTKPEDLDDLLANPIVFTVYEALPRSPTKDKKRGVGDQKPTTIIGQCALDLMPIVVATWTNIKEDLVLQQDQAVGHHIVTWPNLPRLAVQLTTGEPLITREEIEASNIALLTLEGVYNISNAMLDAASYSAGLSIQLQPGLYKDIVFDGGTVTRGQNTDISKRWCNLSAQHGKAAFTDYTSTMDYNLETIRNEVDVDLNEVTARKSPRIEWNKVRRSLILNEAKSPFLLGLTDKNKVLPIEVFVLPVSRKAELEKPKSRKEKDKEKEKDKDKDREKDISDQPLHFVAYLKFEDFFQPGCLKCRVCSQLFNFDVNNFKMKSARSKFIFENKMDTGVSSPKEKKKPVSSRSNRIFFQPGEKGEEPGEAPKTVPALNDDGEPMFIIFEIELFKPICFSESQLRKLEKSELKPVPGIPLHDSDYLIKDMSQRASDEEDEEQEIPMRKSPQPKRGLITTKFRDKNIKLQEVSGKTPPLKRRLPEQELDERVKEQNNLILGLTEKFSTAKNITPKELTPIEPPNFNIENDEIIMHLLSSVPEKLIAKLRQKGIKFDKPKFKDIVLDLLLPKHETLRISSLTNLLHKSQSLPCPVDELTQCISGLANVILDAYAQFLDSEDPNTDKIVYGPQKAKDDRISEFFLYLQSAGLYNGIRQKLHHKIYSLLSVGCPEKIEQKKSQHDLYISLLEEIHLHINSMHPHNYDYCEPEEFHQQLYFALEADEEGKPAKAKTIYLERLGKHGHLYPHLWSEYAVHCLNRDELGMAVESVKEAIVMQRRDKMALLIYGVLLVHYKYIIEANLFLEAVTCFYPRSMECWMVLHLFYLLILNYTKAEWALNMAYRLYDGIIDREPMNFPLFDMDQLCWNPIPDPHDDIFLYSARFLMKLRMRELAETALAQHMNISGPTVPYTYYLSVNHYLARRYVDALSHLEGYSPNKDQGYCMLSLVGHCLYKEKEYERAAEHYNQIMFLDDLPPDMHLVNMRLANCYMKSGQVKEAENLFYTASLISPSPMTWTDLGIAFYQQNKYLEAEMAFSEALRLDCTEPLLWAYLSMISLTYNRTEEFNVFLNQARKLKLPEDMHNKIVCLSDVKCTLAYWSELMLESLN